MGSRARDAEWESLILWIPATLIGWFGGIAIAIVLTYSVVMRFHPEETNLIVGLCGGIGIGTGQIVSFRRKRPLNYRWILGTTIGMGIPYTVAVMLREGWLQAIDVSDTLLVIIAIVAGALAGVTQAPSLKRHTTKASWWIWASVVSWTVAWLISDGFNEWGFLIGALVYGALSGSFLIWLIGTSASGESV